MKKFAIICLSLVLSILFSSCFSSTQEPFSNTYKELKSLPMEYPSEMAKKNGDVVYDNNGKVYNIEKLDKFFSSYKNSKKGVTHMVRITSYGEEGGAMIYDLIKNNKEFKLTTDNTRDAWSGKNKSIREFNIIDVLKQEKSNGIVYIAKLADGEEIPLVLKEINDSE